MNFHDTTNEYPDVRVFREEDHADDGDEAALAAQRDRVRVLHRDVQRL